MKEYDKMQTTQADLNANNGKPNPNAKILITPPIQQLELKVSLNDKEDNEQIQKLLTTILAYPSTQLAEIHRDANRLGNRDIQLPPSVKKNSNQLTSQAVFCSCCGFIKQQDEIKLCQQLDDINNLGLSTFLYFQTIKNLSIILIEMILIYSIYAFATNLIASGKFNQCGTVGYAKCSTNLDYLSISLGSKQHNQTDQNKRFYYIQAWIGVAMVLVWLLTFLGLKLLQRKKQIEVDTQTVSASDFSLVIENVPEDFTQEQLQAQFNQYEKNVNNIPKFMKKPLKITKFNKGKPFQIDPSELKDENLEKLQKQQKQMIQKFIGWIKERQDSQSFSTMKEQRQKYYNLYTQNLSAQQKIIEQLNEKMKKKFQQQNSQSNTVVFVTLETNHARSMVVTLNPTDTISKLRNFIMCNDSSNRLQLTHKNQTLDIRIGRAPQPEDVIWTNVGFSDGEKLKRKIITYSVTVVMLGLSFAAVYGLSKAQVENSQNRYLSILISLVISIINYLISRSIRILSLYERDYTTIKYQTSLAIKSVLAQLVNSIVVPMFANRFIKSNIYDKNGLADDIFMLGLTNAFVPPIMKFIDLGYYYAKIMAWYNSKPNNKLYFNQHQLNTIFIGIEFETGYQYIYVVNLFLFVCFFVSLQPIISVFALLGYFLMFWAQKWALFNRMRRPVPGNDLINQAMNQLIFFGPVAYSLGSLTWSNFLDEGIPKQALIPNLVAVGISFITLIFPISILFACLLQKNTQKEIKYEENRAFLSTEYDRLNPATAKQGFDDYMNHLEKMKEEMKNAPEEKRQQMAKKFDLNAQRGQQAMMAQNINMAQMGNSFFPGFAQFRPQMPMMAPMMPMPMFQPQQFMTPQIVYRPNNVTPQFGASQINQTAYRPNQQFVPLVPQLQQQPQQQPQQQMVYGMQPQRPMHPAQGPQFVNPPPQQVFGFGQSFQQRPMYPQYQQQPMNPFNFGR